MPLKLTLELIPYGDISRTRVIGALEIENTGDHPHHPKLANYKYLMTGLVIGSGEVDLWHEGIIRDVERSRGYWALIKEILNVVDCESQSIDNDHALLRR